MSIENILELGCYVTAVVFVTNITECSRQTNIREVKTLLYQRQKMTDVKKKKTNKESFSKKFQSLLFSLFLFPRSLGNGKWAQWPCSWRGSTWPCSSDDCRSLGPSSSWSWTFSRRSFSSFSFSSSSCSPSPLDFTSCCNSRWDACS